MEAELVMVEMVEMVQVQVVQHTEILHIHSILDLVEALGQG